MYHIMPWEIDYCLLTFTQLKKSKYFLPKDCNITIHSVLNLSSHSIDWTQSKISKTYFIEKYHVLSNLLCDYIHIKEIYDGDELYGHLNLQKEIIKKETDYYISICPDIYFSSKALTHLIESTRLIKNKYFTVTNQISKFWDSTWDFITQPQFLNDIPHNEWFKRDVFDIVHFNESVKKDITLVKPPFLKWAGWFDLYNKEFYENLCPCFDDWNGYGAWDYYSMLVVSQLRGKIDFQQYLVHNEVVFEYSVGPLYGKYRDGFSPYYKSQIVMKNVVDTQRSDFENNIPLYVNKRIKTLIDNKVV